MLDEYSISVPESGTLMGFGGNFSARNRSLFDCFWQRIIQNEHIIQNLFFIRDNIEILWTLEIIRGIMFFTRLKFEVPEYGTTTSGFEDESESWPGGEVLRTDVLYCTYCVYVKRREELESERRLD
jgi:hypothetical protein